MSTAARQPLLHSPAHGSSFPVGERPPPDVKRGERTARADAAGGERERAVERVRGGVEAIGEHQLDRPGSARARAIRRPSPQRRTTARRDRSVETRPLGERPARRRGSDGRRAVARVPRAAAASRTGRTRASAAAGARAAERDEQDEPDRGEVERARRDRVEAPDERVRRRQGEQRPAGGERRRGRAAAREEREGEDGGEQRGARSVEAASQADPRACARVDREPAGRRPEPAGSRRSRRRWRAARRAARARRG